MTQQNYSQIPYQDAPRNSSSFVLSLLGVIMAFIFPLAGFVLSLLGLKQAKEAGESTTLATVGWILNAVILVGGLLFFLGFLLLVAFI